MHGVVFEAAVEACCLLHQPGIKGAQLPQVVLSPKQMGVPGGLEDRIASLAVTIDVVLIRIENPALGMGFDGFDQH